MRFDILTLFPEIFDSFIGESILKRALKEGLLEVHRWNMRDWSRAKHHKVDDRPYGGGPGMVIRPDVVVDAVEAVLAADERPATLLLMSPAGERLHQDLVAELARQPRLVMLCGRYEGFDERVRLGLRPREVSIGDFVCNGGEVPAMVVVESVMRLLPGVLGDEESAREDSFHEPGWIEYPQYTRPVEFRGMRVPEVLLSGHHAEIARWRQEQALARSRGSDRSDPGASTE